MRSTAWFVLFAAAVLAPLLVATWSRSAQAREFASAFGIACGWLALSLFALEFALVTRVRAAAAAFGSDALLFFHRAMALAALAFVVPHVALLAPGFPDPFSSSAVERSGALAAWAAALLIVSSLARRRLRMSYEFWLVAHRLLAVTVVGAMTWHAWLFVGPDDFALQAVVLGYAALALVLLAVQRFLRPIVVARKPWELIENRDEGASTHTLVLRAVGHHGLRFSPGQFVWIATARRGLVAQEHPITVASSPELDGGRTLELAIKELGDWSREVVPALKVGERVRIDGPFGAFSPDGVAAQRLVLVAGGVGVTPMRSILLAMRDRGDKRPVTLFFAASNRSRAMFIDELERLSSEIDLKLVPVFENPDEGERCERGLLSAEIFRKHLPSDLRFTHVFVCGPAPMMDLMERIAGELGLRSRQLHTERFDMV
jgi:predicted ferric reductase